MSIDTVELHFIDGPLAGTRKIELQADIAKNRTYRVLHPVNYFREQKVDTKSDIAHVQVVCTE